MASSEADVERAPSDAADAARWVGRTRSRREVILSQPVERMARVFDVEVPPVPYGRVPEGWHWLFFLPEASASELGPDGHPKRGGFLPPIPHPRRMFGGSTATFPAPLLIGLEAELTEEIVDIRSKIGRSGPIALVTIDRRIEQGGEPRVRETRTIVYRPASAEPTEASPPAVSRTPREADWRVEQRPGTVELFRFSAVTFNAHRIHYDRDYATGVEGYPGLVIHGPYTALRLLEEARRRRPEARVAGFAFRPTAPLFDVGGFSACGRWRGNAVELWAETPEGATAMEASATFEMTRGPD